MRCDRASLLKNLRLDLDSNKTTNIPLDDTASYQDDGLWLEWSTLPDFKFINGKRDIYKRAQIDINTKKCLLTNNVHIAIT